MRTITPLALALLVATLVAAVAPGAAAESVPARQSVVIGELVLQTVMPGLPVQASAKGPVMSMGSTLEAFPDVPMQASAKGPVPHIGISVSN